MTGQMALGIGPVLGPILVSGMAPTSARPTVHGASARERLRSRGQAVAPWAVFYPDWYSHTYPDAVPSGSPGFQEILRRYLDHGQAAGHSPNPLFDEAWYRAAYPHVAAAIASGQVQSGFDQYCRAGFVDHSPHWLFDEQYYRRRYPGLTDETLAARGALNGYAHFLRIGDREGRSGSPFLDPNIYRANADAETVAMIDAEGAFLAFLRQLGANPAGADPIGANPIGANPAGAAQVERRTTRYFDPDWYRAAYPEVAEAIAAGRWHSALHHYLANTTPTAFDPLPVFSERDYLARHPDIAEAIEAAQWRNGYAHFLANGSAELRTPSAVLDLRWYVENNASVRGDLAVGRAPEAFTHYLAIGRDAGLPSAPPPESATIEADDSFATLFRARARALLPIIARTGLDFTCAGPPLLSVIMLLRDGFAVTMQSLAALRDRDRSDIELILVDCASRDEGRHVLRYVRGARLLRFDLPIEPAVARNAALCAVTAPAVLLLGNHTEVAHGATEAALRRMNGDERIGAVGGKVVGQDGRLRDAGGIIRCDGTLQTYLCGASPLAPEANFVRDVDFCSVALLLVRSTLLRALDGFDETIASPNYAAADLCVRVVGAGYRVVYEPSVSTHRLDGPAMGSLAMGGSGSSEAQAFVGKHRDHLRARRLAEPTGEVFARDLSGWRKRVLFIEDLVPLRRIGSGFVRSNDLISRDGFDGGVRHGISAQPRQLQSRGDLCRPAGHGRSDVRTIAGRFRNVRCRTRGLL